MDQTDITTGSFLRTFHKITCLKEHRNYQLSTSIIQQEYRKKEPSTF